jgi:tRNA (adenine22-N1)-methyltransferase
MIKISDRLKIIGDYVSNNASIVDIGCDHALLDIYIYKTKKDINIIATDIHEGALEQARTNIKKYRLEGFVETRLGDGLDIIDSNEIDTIIIAGMGHNSVLNILKKNKSKLKNVQHLIIQSNSNVNVIRKEITKLGYYIDHESLVIDKRIIYTIISFKKGKRKYHKKEFLFGPILMKEKKDLYIKYINNEIIKNNILLSLIPNKYFIKRLKLIRYISMLEKELK